VWIDEARGGAVERVATRGHRLLAVRGELADHGALAGVERGHVGAGVRDLETELCGVLGEVENLGAVEERLRGHAAAQDAEAAEGGGGVDDRDAFGEVAGDAGGVEAGGAAAEGEEVVVRHAEGES
jgi:hypothetical protein